MGFRIASLIIYSIWRCYEALHIYFAYHFDWAGVMHYTARNVEQRCIPFPGNWVRLRLFWVCPFKEKLRFL